MKDRLDVILVKKGFFESRERAKASIMAGLVFVDGKLCDKAGTGISDTADIFVKQNLCPYVSRGGLKLEKAIDEFQIKLNGKICMDIGASTGGFTDCMLQNGAQKVYAIDVGRGQLDWKLRTDERVINIERTNIRYYENAEIQNNVDFASVDVSFISLNLIFPVMKKMLNENGFAVCLVKPQFEAGREQVGNKGIVKDKKVHADVINKVIGYAKNQDLIPLGITYSPLTGAKGNIEFLLYLKNAFDDNALDITEKEIIKIVDAAHSELEI
ncbi:MAG: TlyA family RNA methyltransferase [Eubacteriales bacterium]